MITQRFNEEFQKDLMSTPFKRQDLLPRYWYESVWEALHIATPANLGVSITDFAGLYKTLEHASATPIELSLFQVAIANNLLENCTAKQLSLPISHYVQLQEDVRTIAMAFAEITKPMRAAVQKRINDEEKAKAISAGDKPPFKHIVGQA